MENADKVYVDVGKAEMPSIFSCTDIEDVYNACETALLYRKIPS
jgi:hypothetical protein